MNIEEFDMFEQPVKSGIVAIVGPPNAGKSTLMNRLLGQKISIVTPKPQTTRNRILGVVNGEDYQIVLLDTPGLHKTDKPLNREMVRVALDSLQEVDVVLFLVDIAKQLSKEARQEREKEFVDYMGQVESKAFLLLNKIDLVPKKELLPMITHFSELYPFHAVIPVSALKGEGVDTLLLELLKLMPMGHRYFPEDIPTDASERFLVGEIVREKLFLLTGQEIPYSSAVLIDSFKENPDTQKVTIHATIILERSSQKGMVIGKGGHKLKSIGIAARKDIEKLIGQKVNLKLWVKVKKNWSRNERFLKELGY